jgi:hypothetical protein
VFDEAFRDLLRSLRAHPDWLEELRAVILTEELLALPGRFTALEQRQDRTEQRQVGTEQRQDRLEQRHVGTEQRQDRMEQQLRRIDDRLAALEGESVERRYRDHGPGYFGRIARRVRPVSRRDRDDLLDAMEDDGRLRAAEADQIRLADAIFTARRGDVTVYLLVEASRTVGADDVRRAADRAALLARSGVPTLPVVAGTGVARRRGGPGAGSRGVGRHQRVGAGTGCLADAHRSARRVQPAEVVEHGGGERLGGRRHREVR